MCAQRCTLRARYSSSGSGLNTVRKMTVGALTSRFTGQFWALAYIRGGIVGTQRNGGVAGLAAPG